MLLASGMYNLWAHHRDRLQPLALGFQFAGVPVAGPSGHVPVFRIIVLEARCRARRSDEDFFILSSIWSREKQRETDPRHPDIAIRFGGPIGT
jgi:hypothetical protein